MNYKSLLMRTKNDLNQKSKLRLSHRLSLLLIGGSAIILLAVILLIINIGRGDKAQAAGITTVISQFDWESGPGIALVGPDALSISSSAKLDISPTGQGINPGLPEKDINLKLPGSNFDVNGLDIQVDYQRDEPEAYFFKRNTLRFGIKNGKIKIKYKVNDAAGNTYNISGSFYSVPNDDNFRTYRFIYDPNTGVGEVMVDSVIQWIHYGIAGETLYTGTGDVFIGKKMNGNESNKTAMDNLLIRSISFGGALPVELTFFNAEVQSDRTVLMSWQTATELNNDYFTIERSINGSQFKEIGRIEGIGNSTSLNNYSFIDQQPFEGISYYRLKQTDLNGAYEYFAPVVVDLEMQRQVLEISASGPNPFINHFNIDYIPAISGYVNIKLFDLQGRLIVSSSQQAVPGINQFAFDEGAALLSGTYIVQISQGNEPPVSIKLIKQ